MMRLVRTLVPILTIGLLTGLSPDPAQALPVTLPLAVPLITRTLQLRQPSDLSNKWAGIAKIDYGTATPKLGTSPGGEGLMLGPDYGVQVPDRTWWYADAAKLRLAHYSDAGAYLGQVKLPTKYLNEGVYFQWSNPVALADGTIVLTSTTINSPGLLLLAPNHTLKRVRLGRFVNVVVTDGHSLYGFDESSARVKVRPRTGAIITVSSFKGQRGRTFSISVATSRISVRRPGVNLRLNLVEPAHPSTPIQPAVEAVVGADGKLWILATGIVEVSPGNAHDVIGLFSVSVTGAVSAVYKVRTLFSESDPGGGHHLGIRQGSSKPTLMFIDSDAARVFRKV
ncbi:MAG: hypothetical protein ACOH1Y_02520 [Propionicimonas sp.]